MADHTTSGAPDGECGCGGGERFSSAINVSDLVARPVDLPRVTREAVIEGTKRGQDLPKCPTDRLFLHSNFTGAVVNVSGDLKVDAKSCKVQLVWANGAKGNAIFDPGTDVGITVPLAAGAVLTGSCVETEKEKHCKWSFTRTSP